MKREDNPNLRRDFINSIKAGVALIGNIARDFYRSWENHVEYLDSADALKYI
jgi:hypothetical protein